MSEDILLSNDGGRKMPNTLVRIMTTYCKKINQFEFIFSDRIVLNEFIQKELKSSIKTHWNYIIKNGRVVGIRKYGNSLKLYQKARNYEIFLELLCDETLA
jgi:hypothetical protein